MRNLLYVFILVFVMACNNLPSGVLEPEKMEKVLIDYIKADVFVQEFVGRDSSKNKLVESVKLQKQIFNTHNISKETFYKSLDYYLTHPKQFSPILDSISATTNRGEAEAILQKLTHPQ